MRHLSAGVPDGRPPTCNSVRARCTRTVLASNVCPPQCAEFAPAQAGECAHEDEGAVPGINRLSERDVLDDSQHRSLCCLLLLRAATHALIAAATSSPRPRPKLRPHPTRSSACTGEVIALAWT